MENKTTTVLIELTPDEVKTLGCVIASYADMAVILRVLPPAKFTFDCISVVQKLKESLRPETEK